MTLRWFGGRFSSTKGKMFFIRHLFLQMNFCFYIFFLLGWQMAKSKKKRTKSILSFNAFTVSVCDFKQREWISPHHSSIIIYIFISLCASVCVPYVVVFLCCFLFLPLSFPFFLSLFCIHFFLSSAASTSSCVTSFLKFYYYYSVWVSHGDVIAADIIIIIIVVTAADVVVVACSFALSAALCYSTNQPQYWVLSPLLICVYTVFCMFESVFDFVL